MLLLYSDPTSRHGNEVANLVNLRYLMRYLTSIHTISGVRTNSDPRRVPGRPSDGGPLGGGVPIKIDHQSPANNPIHYLLNDAIQSFHTPSRLYERNSNTLNFQVLRFPQDVKNSRRTRRHSADVCAGICRRSPTCRSHAHRGDQPAPVKVAQKVQHRRRRQNGRSRVTLCRFGTGHTF